MSQEGGQDGENFLPGQPAEASFDTLEGDEEDRKAKIRLRNRDAQRRLRARKRAAAQETAKTLEEVDDAIAKAEDVNERLDVDNMVLEKVIAVREEFIAALQYLQQLDIVVSTEELAAREPLPPEVQELTCMGPTDFAAQWRRWHRAVAKRYQMAEASGWNDEASEELNQHVAYLVAIFQALTLTAPDNVLALYAAMTDQTGSVAQSLPRWQLIAASLEVSEEQLVELRVVYETYLRRMARLIANRNAAYAGVGQVSCPSPSDMSSPGAPSPGPPSTTTSLINLAQRSSELQRSLEQVTTTYKTEYHVMNDLLDSVFSIFTPRQVAHVVAASDPAMPDYLQVVCCIVNNAQQPSQPLPQRMQEEGEEHEQRHWKDKELATGPQLLIGHENKEGQPLGAQRGQQQGMEGGREADGERQQQPEAMEEDNGQPDEMQGVELAAPFSPGDAGVSAPPLPLPEQQQLQKKMQGVEAAPSAPPGDVAPISPPPPLPPPQQPQQQPQQQMQNCIPAQAALDGAEDTSQRPRPLPQLDLQNTSRGVRGAAATHGGATEDAARAQ